MDAGQLDIIIRDIQANALVSEEEDRDLRANFALEAVRYPCTMRARTDSDISVLEGDAHRLLKYCY